RHVDERAFPGYYAVQFRDPGILAEFTATPRTGIHRYTFSGENQPHILLDVCSILGNKRVEGGSVILHPESGEVEGEVKTFGTFAGRYGGITVYFHARFDHPYSNFLISDGAVSFPGQSKGTGRVLILLLVPRPGRSV
ncbi:MAG: hypothetical protein JZU67_05685, partial [Burkholderiaceae bacterium]|nr:hypothetical protein [Burkholderiaceae bacterium]